MSNTLKFSVMDLSNFKGDHTKLAKEMFIL